MADQSRTLPCGCRLCGCLCPVHSPVREQDYCSAHRRFVVRYSGPHLPRVANRSADEAHDQDSSVLSSDGDTPRAGSMPAAAHSCSK